MSVMLVSSIRPFGVFHGDELDAEVIFADQRPSSGESRWPPVPGHAASWALQQPLQPGRLDLPRLKDSRD